MANLDDSFIFVMGGGSESRSTIRLDSATCRFNFSSNEWEELSDINQAR